MGRDVDMWRCVKSCGYLFNAVSLCHSEFDLLRTVYAFMQQLIEHMNLSCPVYLNRDSHSVSCSVATLR